MRKMISLSILLICVSITVAGPFRNRRNHCTSSNYTPSNNYVSDNYIPDNYVSTNISTNSYVSTNTNTNGSDDALDEVNATRAQRGLRSFIKDDLLTIAAKNAASIRASSLIAGHTSNDFNCIPSGGSASAAGCAAWTPDWGWGACCTYESYTYAGAAWVMGRDGRRYMHLFVR